MNVDVPPWASVLTCILEAIKVLSFGCVKECNLIPRTSVLMCVFQAQKVSSPGCFRACAFVPRTSVLMCVFQAHQGVLLLAAFRACAFHPTDIRSHVRISGTKGILYWLLQSMYFCPTDIRSRVTYFRHERRPLLAAAEHVRFVPRASVLVCVLSGSRKVSSPDRLIRYMYCISQGHPFSCDVLSGTRGALSPAACSCMYYSFHGHPFSCAYFQALKVSVFGCFTACLCVP